MALTLETVYHSYVIITRVYRTPTPPQAIWDGVNSISSTLCFIIITSVLYPSTGSLRWSELNKQYITGISFIITRVYCAPWLAIWLTKGLLLSNTGYLWPVSPCCCVLSHFLSAALGHPGVLPAASRSTSTNGTAVRKANNSNILQKLSSQQKAFDISGTNSITR